MLPFMRCSCNNFIMHMDNRLGGVWARDRHRGRERGEEERSGCTRSAKGVLVVL
jgi:hypothetical protein